MANKKIILVTGTTGAQGGNVAKALLQKGEFAVRAFTRNPNGEKAKKLGQLGAEIAAGDLSDMASLEEAMNGCYGVFGLTDFWEHFQNEYTLGMNLVEAVAISGIEHFVLHTLPDYNALSAGEFEVPHCDIKARIKAFSQELRLRATYLQVAFYYENFLGLFLPRQDEFGTFQFGFPQGKTKLAMVSVEDIGPIVAEVFAKPETYIGRTLTAVGADANCDAYATVLTRELGAPVHYNHVPRDLYRSFGFPGAEELANMFEVQRLYITSRRKEMEECYRINPSMQSFETWVRKNRDRFHAAMKPRRIEATLC